VLDVSAYPGDLLVQSFRGRVVCSRCGNRDDSGRRRAMKRPAGEGGLGGANGPQGRMLDEERTKPTGDRNARL
jgi:hypothetical protein